jgi:hypothetical protein
MPAFLDAGVIICETGGEQAFYQAFNHESHLRYVSKRTITGKGASNRRELSVVADT